MVRSIEQTLKKIREKIKPLLLEIYPNMQEGIQFAYEDNFQEWFGMLFKLNEWQMRPGMIGLKHLEMSKKLIIKARKENQDREGDIEDYGYVSVVQIENDFHLIDGYHRVLEAQDEGMLQLKGVIWEKQPNYHENCAKIKKLIIDEL